MTKSIVIIVTSNSQNSILADKWISSEYLEGGGDGILHRLNINNAGMNIHVQVLYKHIFSFLLGIYPRVGLLGHMVTLCYFKELPDYLWQQLHIFTSLLTMYESSNFLISSYIIRHGPRSQQFTSIFSSKNFAVLALTLRSVIHF